MKINTKISKGIIGIFFLLLSQHSLAQWRAPTTVPVHTITGNPEIVVFYSYEKVTAGRGHQDLKIICKNLYTDKLEFKIEYEVVFHNGVVEHITSTNKIILGPGETFDPKSVADWGGVYKRFFINPSGGKYGAKESWFPSGNDKYNNPLYSAINYVRNMEVKDFVNISRKEREEKEKLEKDRAEVEKQKKEKDKKLADELQQKKKKEEEEKNKKDADNNQTESASKNNADDFWSDNTNNSGQNTTSTKSQTSQKDDSFVSDSKFQNNLRGIKEGEYFSDGQGGYYQRTSDGAKKVDKRTYEQDAANKIYADMERREVEREQRDAKFEQDWNNFSTSFYAMSNAKEGMRDASNLDENYKTIEQLNAAFSQKISDIRQMSTQLQQSSTQAIQSYSSALTNAGPSNAYDYSGAVSILGALGSSIAANSEAKKAREELNRQRDAQEAEIKAKQLSALLALRTEIGKMYTEGGMPLSSHKIDAPVLFLFAYENNKEGWNQNKNIDIIISNIIPVYRYSDGGYPYTSNVKRIFENAGIKNPAIIGYFTNKKEAEKYRNSLIEVAPNAKFTLKNIEVKVKEQTINTSNKSSSTDFWGTDKNKNTEETKTETDFWGNDKNKNTPETKTEIKTETKSEKKTETDFWETPTKEKKTTPKKTDDKKKTDFWD